MVDTNAQSVSIMAEIESTGIVNSKPTAIQSQGWSKETDSGKTLARHINQECAKCTNSRKIEHYTYGGMLRRTQVSRLREGEEIAICMPDCLLDFLGRATTNLRRVTRWDRLLDKASSSS